jgi:SMODS and SLOG-associating 2TM effector domain 2
MVDAAQLPAARRRWWPLRRRRRDLRAVPFPDQALRRRLELLQYDWASECARAATRTVDGKLVLARLALLRAFAEDAAAVMQQETSEWVFEFQSNLVQLEASAGRAAWAGARPRPQGPREGDAARAAAAEPPVPASSPPPAR